MKIVKNRLLLRNLYAEKYFERFMIFAIGTILVIRIFLFITGYPTVGGDSLHVAHMLWGGLFMLIALFFTMSFVNQFSLYVASILGGIGFGLFIDELGKFVTTDNDYFFQPTFALIYFIFLALYFASRFVNTRMKHSEEESKVNILEIAKLDAVELLTQADLARAKKALENISDLDKEKSIYADLVGKMIPDIPNRYDTIDRIDKYLKKIQSKVVQYKHLPAIIVSFLLFSVLLNLGLFMLSDNLITRASVVLFIALTIESLVVLTGVYYLISRRRLKALQLFNSALIFSILLTTFLQLYYNQFFAILGLLTKLFLYTLVQFMMNNEKE